MSFLFILSGNKLKASSRVRGYWIIKQLQRKGYKSKAINNNGISSLFAAFIFIPFFKVILFQKTYSKYHVLLMRWASFLNKKTVLDIDDAPSRINSEATLKNFKQMVLKADVVSAGSTSLLSFVQDLGANRSVLIPSTIDLELYSNEKQVNEVITLGWIGNGKDYTSDLITIVKPLLKELSKQYSLRFLLIGVNGANELYQEFNDIPNVDTEFIEQLDWSDTAAVSHQINRMDIGLYPLLKNDFNKYKCAFKALEYMACGVPVVSSNVAFNTEVISHDQDGLIAENEQEWLDSLKNLINSQTTRNILGARGREKVSKMYSTSVATDLLLEVVR